MLIHEEWHSPIRQVDIWRAVITKEIRSIIERWVWRNTDGKTIPNNRSLIGNKLVFKIKRDETYREILVALGYSQIPGVDYRDNFIHPSEHIRNKFPNPVHGHRLAYCVTLRQELKKVNRKDQLCLVVHHDDFKNDDDFIELHAVVNH